VHRGAWVFVIGVIAALVVAATAAATTDNYFGFDNLTSSNPPSGACSGFGAGRDCVSGWNFWDYTQIQRNSGSATIGMGFIWNGNHSQINYVPIPFDAGTYTRIWSDGDFSNQTHYNKPACLYLNGTYSYLQCRGIIV